MGSLRRQSRKNLLAFFSPLGMYLPFFLKVTVTLSLVWVKYIFKVLVSAQADDAARNEIRTMLNTAKYKKNGAIQRHCAHKQCRIILMLNICRLHRGLIVPSIQCNGQNLIRLVATKLLPHHGAKLAK